MTHLKTILVPYDFSPHAKHAFEIAWSLARDFAGRLILLHVVPPPVVVGTAEVSFPVYPDENELKSLEEKLHAVKCPGPAVAVECHLKKGPPPETILEMAAAHHCDLIVMGTHGRSGLGRLLVGSVAETVMRHAPCPVLTVRANAEMPAASAAEKQ